MVDSSSAARPSPATPRRGFHIMTKPIGPICNLDCRYCFYIEKEKLYPGTAKWRMSEEVLEGYIRQYIEAQDVPEINFAWQGGEPTLMGLDFFRRIVELQEKHRPAGKRITNAVQTNGTLLDDEWCRFFHDHSFLIGLSIDGPRELHDRYRLDKGGKPTFDRVMAGLALLGKHEVEYNTLTVVHRQNAKRAVDVYRFLKGAGSRFMQFIPLVERIGDRDDQLAEPPLPRVAQNSPTVTPWTVLPEDYGSFLCRIFDEWIHHDVGNVFVQLFEVELAIWMGLPSSLCVFSPTCGQAMALEHNGDLYSCDHYVYPRYHLGNITRQPLRQLAELPQQQQFGDDKRDTLPKYCRECEVRFACNGECPKHRFLKTPNGEPGLNYLCAGYKMFFRHIDPHMQAMGRLLNSGRGAYEIMDILREREAAQAGQDKWKSAGRNDPCPCGSGKKYKKCCMERMRAG